MQQDTFAFIIHPIQIKRDVARKYPLLGKILTEPQINFFSRFFPPVYLSEVNGIISASTGRELKGWLIACPFTPPTMMSVPVEVAYKKSSPVVIWPKNSARASSASERIPQS